MTTFNEAKEGILTLFVTGWADRTAVTIDNEEFDTDSQKDTTGTGADSAWVRLAIRHNFGGQETIGSEGNRKFERRGNFIVSIYTACNNGTQEADNLVQGVLDILDGKRVPGTTVRFNNVIPTEIGVLPNDEDWYLTVVTGAFVYDEVK